MASQTWEDYLRSRNVDTNAQSSNQSAAQQQLQQPNYGPLGDIASTLGTLYTGSQLSGAYGQSADAAAQQAQAMQQQMQSMPTLDSLYGQNSPYSQQLQQTLAAKDAAAGRNSQYGQRAVQLQAALADKGSQYAAQQAQMANQYSQAQTAANNARTQATIGQQQVYGKALGSIFDTANKSGILNPVNAGLKSLYDQYFPQATPNSGPMSNTSQQSMQDRQGSDIPWSNNGQTDATTPYMSNGGIGQMYGADQSNYASGMDTNQAPTSSNNAYSMDNWLQ